MSKKIVQLNEEVIKIEIKERVRDSVEETLNGLPEAEVEKLTRAFRYKRSEQRQGYRSGNYSRNLTTTSGTITLKVPRLKGVTFETAIIERYRCRESSVEEALIEMYLAVISMRRVEDITEALWGSKAFPSTISELNKKAYVHIEDWRNRSLQGGKYPYVYVDGITPFPVRNRLVAYAHCIRKAHLCKVLIYSCLLYVLPYFYCIKHYFTPPAVLFSFRASFPGRFFYILSAPFETLIFILSVFLILKPF